MLASDATPLSLMLGAPSLQPKDGSFIAVKKTRPSKVTCWYATSSGTRIYTSLQSQVYRSDTAEILLFEIVSLGHRTYNVAL